ncbi:hypothetical protein D3C80_1076040 [compost metagenome]
MLAVQIDVERRRIGGVDGGRDVRRRPPGFSRRQLAREQHPAVALADDQDGGLARLQDDLRGGGRGPVDGPARVEGGLDRRRGRRRGIGIVGVDAGQLGLQPRRDVEGGRGLVRRGGPRRAEVEGAFGLGVGLGRPVLGHGDEVGRVRRLNAVEALEDIPADHGDHHRADHGQDLGRAAPHLLEGGPRRRLKRHGGVGIFALEPLDGAQFVQAQGRGVGPHIADGEDARRQDRELALLQRRQEALMHPRHGRQLGHGQARGQARGAKGGAERLVLRLVQSVV